ncbi:MAG: nucleotidyltransferase substrate binding protein [Candidatus Melainabacteria bacterium]|nr:nucleotidyltransferase substrate binding protein [Candidatus Melainabacteria bacterium]
MERLELKQTDAKKALVSLKEIFKEPYSVIIRDATIKRFEYTFDTFWKYFKEYLKIKKGINIRSPKDCFREMLSQGLCNEEETESLLKMTDSRNETTHTYKEEVANEIYSKIQTYTILMEKILGNIKDT